MVHRTGYNSAPHSLSGSSQLLRGVQDKAEEARQGRGGEEGDGDSSGREYRRDCGDSEEDRTL